MIMEHITGYPAKAVLRVRHGKARTQGAGMAGLEKIKTTLEGGFVKTEVRPDSVISVQYNPSSLSVRANANEVEVEQEVRPGLGSAKKQKKQPASVVLTVQLIFDAVPSTSAAGPNSVRLQIEGLMGMIADTANNGVIFAWKNMTFEGIITQMRSTYTMFSTSGAPIRGTVNITITQAMGEGGQKYWNEAFDRCFKT